MDRTFFYATGGFAFGNVDQKFSLSIPTDTLVLKKNDTQTGFVAGGGVEHFINPAWSVKAEYQYIDLGSDTLSGVSSPGKVPFKTSDIDTNFHTVRVGLNYHVHQEYEPLK